jgi:hypothetical protein
MYSDGWQLEFSFNSSASSISIDSGLYEVSTSMLIPNVPTKFDVLIPDDCPTQITLSELIESYAV